MTTTHILAPKDEKPRNNSARAGKTRYRRLLQMLIRFARKSPGEKLYTIRSRLANTIHSIYWDLAEKDWYWKVHSPGNDRTAYVIGLFGTGRDYIKELMLKHLGERAKYLRPDEDIRLHPRPTSMIYCNHATMKYISRAQASPVVMSRVLEAVRSGFADLIFIYRHPLDSLLTNWIWWRTYLRDNIMIPSISYVYRTTEDLCADLEQNFSEFKAFAEGDPDFFAAVPGPRFLSFAEFVEEIELYLESATLALRLEDFTVDPLKEFSKIVKVMSVDLDLSRLQLAPPRTKPYRYLAVKEKVPRFRDFINGLDAQTKRRIEKIGYKVGAELRILGDEPETSTAKRAT